jgi:hypothetical protein
MYSTHFCPLCICRKNSGKPIRNQEYGEHVLDPNASKDWRLSTRLARLHILSGDDPRFGSLADIREKKAGAKIDRAVK